MAELVSDRLGAEGNGSDEIRRHAESAQQLMGVIGPYPRGRVRQPRGRERAELLLDHATAVPGWSVATKISSSVNDSVVSDSGERAFNRATTSAELPLTTTSSSPPRCFSTCAPSRSSAPG